MLFSSLIFIFLFLPLVLSVYFVSPKFIKNYVLLFFSLIFYAWGEPKFVLAMLLSIILNYFFALLISNSKGRKDLRKSFLILSVIFNLGLMFIFKYLNFTISNINTLFGMKIFVQTHVLLPIGISFFTFQAMSYVIDVYNENVKVQKNYTKIFWFLWKPYPPLPSITLSWTVTAFWVSRNFRVLKFQNF